MSNFKIPNGCLHIWWNAQFIISFYQIFNIIFTFWFFLGGWGHNTWIGSLPVPPHCQGAVFPCHDHNRLTCIHPLDLLFHCEPCQRESSPNQTCETFIAMLEEIKASFNNSRQFDFSLQDIGLHLIGGFLLLTSASIWIWSVFQFERAICYRHGEPKSQCQTFRQPVRLAAGVRIKKMIIRNAKLKSIQQETRVTMHNVS